MLDHVIIGITVVLSAAAAVMNGEAARRGALRGRVTSALRAVLAAMYSSAYLWLFFNTNERVAWSRTMTGVSVTTWLVVWIYPAWMLIRLETKSHDITLDKSNDVTP